MELISLMAAYADLLKNPWDTEVRITMDEVRRVAARIAVLVAQPLEDPLGRVTPLPAFRLVCFQGSGR
ncbi:MAG TPA: hypothetical protein VGR73_10555 [Bryobacteraceae bacterium]|nr:hypothetical protein [Bryobacteraceae bacterium]